MRAGIGTERNAVAIDIEIAAEFLAGFEFGGGHHLAAVIGALLVPSERLRETMVHANVKVEHDKDGRLQTVSEIERGGAELEGLRRIFRHQQYVLGVAM